MTNDYNSDDGAYGGYEYDDPETQFQNEFNYLDRVGGCLEQDLFNKKNDYDPVQRFINTVYASAIDLSENNVISVKTEIPSIIAAISTFKNIQYKNPTAFVLGFWVTKNEQRIDPQLFRNLRKHLEKLSYPVRDYDVIRYGNLWLDHYRS
jgi:hypothetical protein